MALQPNSRQKSIRVAVPQTTAILLLAKGEMTEEKRRGRESDSLLDSALLASYGGGRWARPPTGKPSKQAGNMGRATGEQGRTDGELERRRPYSFLQAAKCIDLSLPPLSRVPPSHGLPPLSSSDCLSLSRAVGGGEEGGGVRRVFSPSSQSLRRRKMSSRGEEEEEEGRKVG